jgi:hypothetical protein
MSIIVSLDDIYGDFIAVGLFCYEIMNWKSRREEVDKLDNKFHCSSTIL